MAKITIELDTLDKASISHVFWMLRQLYDWNQLGSKEKPKEKEAHEE